MNNSIERVKQAIEAVVAESSVPEDPVHSKNTLEWLLRLKPDADEALQIAAIGHDIERAIECRKVRRADFDHYDEFKAAHARNSALVLREIMQKCGLPTAISDDVCRLVCRHEVGGDQRSDLLKDADAISYFDVNLPFYFEREGYAETLRRTLWGYRRLSAGMRHLARTITYETDSLNTLLREAVLAANVEFLVAWWLPCATPVIAASFGGVTYQASFAAGEIRWLATGSGCAPLAGLEDGYPSNP